MKIVYAIASLVLLLSSCASGRVLDQIANWQSVAEMEDSEIFVDPSSIKRTGTLVIAREKKVFYTDASQEEYISNIREKYNALGKPEKIEKWADFSYTIYTSEYDCINSRFRVLSVEDYDSKGMRIIRTTPNKNNITWLNVDKETIGDYTFFYVCDHQE